MLTAALLVAAGCGSDDGAGPATTGVPATTDSAAMAGSDDTAATGREDRSAELVGRWDVVSYALPDGGSLTNVVGDAPVFIEFGTDGTVGYHTGCNAGGTGYTTGDDYAVPESALDDTPEGQTIGMGPEFEQTEIGCDGFLGDQDQDLPAAMAAASRFVLDGDRLLLLDEFLLIEAARSG